MAEGVKSPHSRTWPLALGRAARPWLAPRLRDFVFSYFMMGESRPGVRCAHATSTRARTPAAETRLVVRGESSGLVCTLVGHRGAAEESAEASNPSLRGGARTTRQQRRHLQVPSCARTRTRPHITALNTRPPASCLRRRRGDVHAAKESDHRRSCCWRRPRRFAVSLLAHRRLHPADERRTSGCAAWLLGRCVRRLRVHLDAPAWISGLAITSTLLRCCVCTQCAKKPALFVHEPNGKIWALFFGRVRD